MKRKSGRHPEKQLSARGVATITEAYEKDCRRSCSTSPTACLPLCRLNQNTMS